MTLEDRAHFIMRTISGDHYSVADREIVLEQLKYTVKEARTSDLSPASLLLASNTALKEEVEKLKALAEQLRTYKKRCLGAQSQLRMFKRAVDELHMKIDGGAVWDSWERTWKDMERDYPEAFQYNEPDLDQEGVAVVQANVEQGEE
jgi:hypothetical protein